MTRPRTAIAVAVALSAAAALASGCGAKKGERPNLPLACETRQCICTEAEMFAWRTGKKVPVEWKLTGDAYCPDGYVLRLADG